MKKIVLIVILLTLNACGGGSNNPGNTNVIIPGSGTVNYRVTFDMSWSQATHPVGFPGGPHFSSIVGGTHNANVSFWQEGDLASIGIERMAENGATSPLLTIFDQSKIAVDSDIRILGNGINPSPGTTSVTFSMNESHSYLTLVTMLAPSPDWFAGVAGLNLMPNGVWIENESVDLFAYDSGTDDGANYTSPDSNTNPQQAITKIASSPFLGGSNVIPIGKLIIEKL